MDNKDVNTNVETKAELVRALIELINVNKDWDSRILNTKEFFLALRIFGDMKVKSYVEYLSKKEFSNANKKDVGMLAVDVIAFIVEKLPYAQENVTNLVASYIREKPEDVELIQGDKFIAITLDILIYAVPNSLYKMAKIDVDGLKKKLKTLIIPK
jgi:hypothetical protein